MYSKMLVPLDGSELAEAILPHVEALGKGMNLDTILVRVVRPVGDVPVAEAVNLPFSAIAPEPVAPVTTEDKTQNEVEHAQSYLARIEERLRDKGVRVRSVVLVGSPAEEIVSYSKMGDIDVVAMCTHGRTGVQRVVYGSVAGAVMRQTGIPVLMLRMQDPD